MRASDIENWTIKIIDRVKDQEPVEDSRVELKREWPDPQRAARRIAGHANAARGEDILWIVGIDESNGNVTGASQQDFAAWYSQVTSHFNELAPSVVDLNVPVDGTTVVSLLFDASRVPFVVKNPDGGTVSLEVPWREATSIRSARRSDLIRILVPIHRKPLIQIMGGIAYMHSTRKDGELQCRWTISVYLYITPTSQERIVIPFHQCQLEFELPPAIPLTCLEDVTIEPPILRVGIGRPIPKPGDRYVKSVTNDASESEAVIDGPGKLIFKGEITTDMTAEDISLPMQVKGRILPVLIETPVSFKITLLHKVSDQEHSSWKLTLP